MSKRIVIITVVLMGLAGSGTALGLSGSGTEEEPWRIGSLADFDEFAGNADYWDGYTRLETDVNLAGRVYSTAVIASYAGVYSSFDGVFDGNDHKIIDLTIDAGGSYLGLFGYIDDGEIRNLGLEGGFVRGTGDDVGGLAGMSYYGSISNCYSTGDVSGDDSVGGLVGQKGAGSSVSNCYSTGNVSGEYGVGGLVGSDVMVTKGYFSGNVSSKYVVGGLAGHKVGGISNCYATGDVSGEDWVGGLKGMSRTRVSNCYSTGKVEGTGENTGGLVGANGYGTTMGCLYGVISNCYWNTETSGEAKMCGDQYCASLNCDNSYGRTTSELQQQSTFTDWDFINVWAIGEGQTYPYLRTVAASDINKDRITNFLDLCIVAEHWMEED